MRITETTVCLVAMGCGLLGIVVGVISTIVGFRRGYREQIEKKEIHG